MYFTSYKREAYRQLTVLHPFSDDSVHASIETFLGSVKTSQLLESYILDSKISVVPNFKESLSIYNIE